MVPLTGLEPVTPHYECDALPAELKRPFVATGWYPVEVGALNRSVGAGKRHWRLYTPLTTLPA